MMRGLAILVVVVAVIGVAPDARARQRQTGPGAAPPPSTGAVGTPAPSAPPPQDAFTYEPAGRRDPFLNLIGLGTSEARSTARRGDGPAGMSVAEISVRGIMQSRGAYVAMIQGADKKTYIVHQGDKLFDGTIKTITPQEIIVIQEVNDPLSLVKTREVHKTLRTIEDAKE